VINWSNMSSARSSHLKTEAIGKIGSWMELQSALYYSFIRVKSIPSWELCSWLDTSKGLQVRRASPICSVFAGQPFSCWHQTLSGGMNSVPVGVCGAGRPSSYAQYSVH
jgi:hypothetical protein